MEMGMYEALRSISPLRYRSQKGLPVHLPFPCIPTRYPVLRTPRFPLSPLETPATRSPARQRWLDFKLPDLPHSPSPSRPLRRSQVSANMQELQELQYTVTIALRRSTPKFLLTKRQRLWRDAD